VRECAAAGRPVRLHGGSQTRDPLFVADAIEAFVAAAERPEALGHSIPIGGGQEISVIDLSRLVLDLLGSTMPLETSSLLVRPTEIWRSRVDNADAARLLGWQPRVTLREGLARTLGNSTVGGFAS
jgi:nucleoside-diphosphate-sugar epimerase